jgi:hypothetical protein
MSQPYKPYAQALLEKQKYPDMRQYPGGPPVPPYDNAGWTLPLQMGVACDRIEHAFEVQSEKLEKAPYGSFSTASPSSSAYFVLDCQMNASYSIAFSLLKNKAEMFRSKEKIKREDFTAAPGSFIVKNTAAVKKLLPDMLKKWHGKAYGLDSISNIPASSLKNPRIGLYQSWRSNMDEGWTRYVFDDLDVPYTTLHNKDFKPTKKGKKEEKVDLKAKYDVIVFASESAEVIKSGSSGPPSRRGRSSTPPEYEGGIEKEGVDALKSFVEKGGILVTLNSACGLAFSEFQPPASNSLEGVSRSQFFCPTSLLKIHVDNTTPIGYGMPKEAAAMFSRSLAIRTRTPSVDWDRKVVASYPEEDILLSGWLLGEDTISRRAAVVDLKYKKGHIILIGFRSQFRAQSHGTYKFLLNSLLYPGI